MKPVVVTAYDPEWPRWFAALCAHIWPAVQDVALSIEHVGSTAVPGMAAKPVIDIDIVIAGEDLLDPVSERLAQLGYQRRGNLGIEGREAFRAPAGKGMHSHHLYACVNGCLALRNHLLLRDYLRSSPADAAAYSAWKLRLAAEFPRDMDRYTEGKSPFILEILRRQGLDGAELAEIEAANREN